MKTLIALLSLLSWSAFAYSPLKATDPATKIPQRANRPPSAFDISPAIQQAMIDAVADNVNTLKITNAYSGQGCSVQNQFVLIDTTAGTDGTYSTYLYIKQGTCGALVESVTWKLVIRNEDRNVQDAFVLYVPQIQYGACLPR